MSRQDDRNGGSSVLRRLWGELGVSWGERILHHGARVLLVVVLAGLLTSFFLPAEGPVVQPYDSWSVAPEDVIARFSFDVPKTPAELEAEQNSVREGVPPTFDFVPEFADTMRAELERFFDQLDSAVVADDRAGILDRLTKPEVETAVLERVRPPLITRVTSLIVIRRRLLEPCAPETTP